MAFLFFLHHTAVCVAVGERPQLHYVVRDQAHAWAEKAGFGPEKKRPAFCLGLLVRPGWVPRHIACAMAGRIGVLALNAENSVLQEVEMVVRSGPGGFQASKWVGWLKGPSSQSPWGFCKRLTPLGCRRTCVGWLFCFVVPSVSIPAICFPCWLLLNFFFWGLSAVTISVVVYSPRIFFYL